MIARLGIKRTTGGSWGLPKALRVISPANPSFLVIAAFEIQR